MTAAALAPTATQIANSRIFKAPRELVFSMFTDAQHVSNWWGPRGFRTVTKQMDVKPGGLWLHTMISAEGVEYPNEVRYEVVDAPRQIVYEHINDPLFTATINFTELGPDKTEVDFTLDFHDEKLRDAVAKNGAVEGLYDTLARFEEVVATQGGDELVIQREFNAPQELVYKVWTEPERLERWFGPVGMKFTVEKADVRAGGKLVYSVTMPDGNKMWARWSYRDLKPYERMVLVMAFVDENENPITHASAANAPVDRLSVVTFEERDGKTLMTLRTQGMYTTEAQKSAFVEMFKGMEKGMHMAFDKLDVLLAE